ncbi:MAG TPA: hypothetical protein VKB78_05085 [Pirellulales bacterium]|nr:hypothetical protein [Pirellulales bacterium]
MLRFTRNSGFRRCRRSERRRGAASAIAANTMVLPGGALLATNYVSQAIDAALQSVSHLDRNAWLFVLIGALVIGLICLRGFGSRSDY